MKEKGKRANAGRRMFDHRVRSAARAALVGALPFDYGERLRTGGAYAIELVRATTRWAVAATRGMRVPSYQCAAGEERRAEAFALAAVRLDAVAATAAVGGEDAVRELVGLPPRRGAHPMNVARSRLPS